MIVYSILTNLALDKKVIKEKHKGDIKQLKMSIPPFSTNVILSNEPYYNNPSLRKCATPLLDNITKEQQKAFNSLLDSIKQRTAKQNSNE